MRSSRPSTSACRIRGSIGSWGSPTPKSMNSTPSAASRRLASSSRVNGYWPSSLRTGEKRTASDRTGEQEALQRLEYTFHRRNLDALLSRVRVACLPGAEVDRVDAAGGEVRHVRPRLLGLDRKPADCAEPLHVGVSERDAARRRQRDGLELAEQLAGALERARLGAQRREAEAVVDLDAVRDHVVRDPARDQ